MDASRPTLAMLAACLLAAAVLPLSAAQGPILQADGFQARLTGDKLAGNPLGLTAAVAQQEGMELPNGGMTFSSQVNAELSDDAKNLWTYEFDGYNVENVGLATLHNIKDPSWPVVLTLFQSVSSPDFAPIVSNELTIQDLDKLSVELKDASGKPLGYKNIKEAVNATALGAVVRMANDPTQAIFGVLGNDISASDLKGGIDQPVNPDTFMPLTDEELAALPDPASLKPEADPNATPTPTPVAAAPAAAAAPAPVADDAAVSASAPSPAISAPEDIAPSPAPATTTAAPPAAPTPTPVSGAAGIMQAGAMMAAAMMAGLMLLA